jgi:NADH:ubiquinone oxidoreductase subunit 5 (subunit L)/multisubunit Na+/H+ antiporter MnhA subunit
MTVPLVVLAVLSVLIGYVGLPSFAFPNWIAPWLQAATASVPFDYPPLWAEWLLIGVAVLVAAASAWRSRGGSTGAAGRARRALRQRAPGRLRALGRRLRRALPQRRRGPEPRARRPRWRCSIVTCSIAAWRRRHHHRLAGARHHAAADGFVRDYALAMLIGAVVLVLVVVLAGVRA